MNRAAVQIALLLLLLATSCWANSVPIVRDGNGDWQIDSNSTFAVSSLTLDIRRFALIPDTVPNVRPRLNALAYAPGDDRLFIIDEGLAGSNAVPTGSIYAVSADGSNVEEILNVGSVIPLQHEGGAFGAQGGLRGVAFHPQFCQAGTPGFGKLYTTQIVVRPDDTADLNYLGPSTPAETGDGLLAEWTATFDAQGKINGIDAESFREIFRIAIPVKQHPLKQPIFNPFAQPGDEDFGLLYVSQGDGNAPGQSSAGDSALGKILRINPLENGPPENGPPENGPDGYSIPISNPFVSDASVLDEIYTLGHRNPHSLSFAKDEQGATHLLVGEIGFQKVEEINLINRGGDHYGWHLRQGTFVTSSGGNVVDLPDGPTDPDDGYIYPVAQLGHDGNEEQAVAGGYVIANGSELDGQYLFGDFPTTGDLFHFAIEDAFNAVISGAPANLDPVDILQPRVLFDADNDPSTASIETTVRNIILNDPNYSGGHRIDLRFGQGPGGELYILNKRNGWIYLVSNSIAQNGIHPGDFNLDGGVDGTDFLKWQRGQSPNPLSASDLADWAANYGAVANLVATSTVVPEPETWITLLIGVMAMFNGRGGLDSRSSH